MQYLLDLVLSRLLPDALASLCGHHFYSENSEISFDKSEYIAFHHSVVIICKKFHVDIVIEGRLAAGTREITTLCNNDNGNVMYGS